MTFTHSIPPTLGGNGNALIKCFSFDQSATNEAAKQIVKWLGKQFSVIQSACLMEKKSEAASDMIIDLDLDNINWEEEDL